MFAGLYNVKISRCNEISFTNYQLIEYTLDQPNPTMKNLNHLDLIVFENRNKKYGAYWLRSTYTIRLKTATLFVCASMLFITLFSLGFKKPGADPRNLKVVLEEKIYTIEMPPLPELKKQQEVTRNTQNSKATGVSNKVVSSTIAPVISTNTGDTSLLNASNQTVGGNQTAVGSTGTDTLSNATSTSGNTTNQSALNFAEEMPEFPGGYTAMKQFIVRNYEIPRNVDLPEKGFRIVVNFVVNEKGEITNPTVVQGYNEYCDKEALRVLSKMPAWKPGKQGGRPVNVIYNLPISIRFSY